MKKFYFLEKNRPGVGSDLNCFARVCSSCIMTSTTESPTVDCLVLKQGLIYRKNRKAFSKFYHRHSELIVKYNIGIKILMHISEPVFYGDLVYKFLT